MKKFLLYIWQLPQNIIGLLVIWFTGAKKKKCLGKIFYFSDKYEFGVSLGNYIILGKYYNFNDILHEFGHQKQSLFLGWLYLPVIGFTSAVFNNLWDRFSHKKWTENDRIKWYYSRFPEKWADVLGGVKR